VSASLCLQAKPAPYSNFFVAGQQAHGESGPRHAPPLAASFHHPNPITPTYVEEIVAGVKLDGIGDGLVEEAGDFLFVSAPPR
jgi:hypothetical protein